MGLIGLRDHVAVDLIDFQATRLSCQRFGPPGGGDQIVGAIHFEGWSGRRKIGRRRRIYFQHRRRTISRLVFYLNIQLRHSPQPLGSNGQINVRVRDA